MAADGKDRRGSEPPAPEKKEQGKKATEKGKAGKYFLVGDYPAINSKVLYSFFVSNERCCKYRYPDCRLWIRNDLQPGSEQNKC
jgi:hypothetical protein